VWSGRLGGCCFVGCDSKLGLGRGNGYVKKPEEKDESVLGT